MQLYPQQQAALSAINDFLDSDRQQVFILRGFAGTGKTTMIKSIIAEVEARNKQCNLLAPTGRAARVLGDKCGRKAETIHRKIYNFSKLEGERHNQQGEHIPIEGRNYQQTRANGVDDFQVWYALKPGQSDPRREVYIVDEASLVSSVKSEHEVFHFGTDVLLDDLLTFVELNKGGKIIFVGDPAQLPPVGDNRSAALSDEFFSQQGYCVQSVDLTEVIRQSEGSVILKNAMKVRDLLQSSERVQLCFERREGEVEDITEMNLVHHFVQAHPIPTIGDSVIICYKNAVVSQYNREIRHLYFPNATEIMVGDILQIVRNCYSANLNNGDFIVVTSVSPHREKQSALVWVGKGAERRQIKVDLFFRTIGYVTEKGEKGEQKIIENLLDSSGANLSPVEFQALYINFRMRHPEIENNREILPKELMEDPYFNALQARYGYAITAHRAQGGEWNEVYVDYSGRTGFDNDALRWNYTATTRAKRRLYGAYMPKITALSKMSFSAIVKTSRLSSCALSIADMGVVEGLPAGAGNAQKAKYLSAKGALAAIHCSIERVTFYNYKDRYTIKTPDGEETYDCTYNGANVYTTYAALHPTANSSAIIEALKSNDAIRYSFVYEPNKEALVQLYAKMQSLCDELQIAISNVVEESDKYIVTYYLYLADHYATMRFYYNQKGSITCAMPSSAFGSEDRILKSLIEKLS